MSLSIVTETVLASDAATAAAAIVTAVLAEAAAAAREWSEGFDVDLEIATAAADSAAAVVGVPMALPLAPVL